MAVIGSLLGSMALPAKVSLLLTHQAQFPHWVGLSPVRWLLVISKTLAHHSMWAIVGSWVLQLDITLTFYSPMAACKAPSVTVSTNTRCSAREDCIVRSIQNFCRFKSDLGNKGKNRQSCQHYESILYPVLNKNVKLTVVSRQFN